MTTALAKPAKGTEQIAMRVKSAAEGIELLNKFRNVMCVYIPLARNEALHDFRDNIRSQNLTTQFKGVMNALMLEDHVRLFPEATSLFEVKESLDFPGEYLLRPKHNSRLSDIDGNPVSLAIPDNLYIHEIATQCDNGRSISRDYHHDKKGMYTFNLYAEGKALSYFLNGQELTFGSPAFTMHRSATHRFGEHFAVKHQGYDQTGPRANCAYEASPIALLL